MGRIVKIWDMGTKGDSADAYHAPNGKYYSTKAAYDNMVKQQVDRQRCIDIILDLLGYQPDMKPNTFIFKLLKELEPYGYEVVYDTINEKMKDICWALSKKSFQNETFKIKYVFAIINNSVMDVYKRKKDQEEQERKTAEVIEFKSRERGVTEVTDGYDIGGVSGKGRDVSDLLGD